MAKTTKSSYFDKIETDIKTNQSTLSLVLGSLIVLIVGVLIFNYFNRNKGADLGPSQQITEGDVSPGDLPGKYTVKEGDTLFLIAEKYYSDGFKYTEIAETNSLTNADAIEVGQVLEIPKIEGEVAQVEPTLQPTEDPSDTQKLTQVDTTSEQEATGGGDTTIWGPKIEGDSYTVVEGDWLSTIAARAYGDIMAYTKISEANNIKNPDLITPGMNLKLPR
ncbi:MAG: hypothetical protein G01um101493_223 [Microgenomates group bacterium Gr01-1014_93]|nr:MAG: hypothetical protein G01um101493_223 [Microgenomates group bacterium Gr01-1014_93]